MIFELQSVPIFRLGDENFLKKSRSHVSESTFYQFYSLKSKFYKKFWKSEKLRAEKVEKSEIFMIFEFQTLPIFRLGDKNFRKITFPCLREHFLSILYTKNKKLKKFWKSEKLRAEKAEKTEIFMIFELQTVPIFRLGDENFRKNHVSMFY